MGDSFVFSDDLFDHNGGDKVGIGDDLVRGRPDHLPGRFTTPTAEHEFPPPFDLAITGGTGDVEGASSGLTVEEPNWTEANLTLCLV